MTPRRCQFAEEAETISQCEKQATRKWGDCWLCDEHGKRADPNRMTAAQFQQRHGSGAGNQVVNASPAKPKIRMPKSKMTKTEAEYGELLKREFKVMGKVFYEPLTLRLPSGNRYTPDWAVMFENEIVLLCETKGSFRLGSAGRSASVFREAVAAFPQFKFRHATKEKGGGWNVTEAN